MFEFADIAKAQVTQGLAAALFEHAGYRVFRLGVEERLGEIKQLSYEHYATLGLPRQLRSLPDLLITDTEMQCAHLVEVKFRNRLDRHGALELSRRLAEQFECWPGTVALVFLGQSPYEDRGYIQDHLRAVAVSDLEVLSRAGVEGRSWWDDLPMLQHRFSRLCPENYHNHADRVVAIIQGLAVM